MTEKQSAIKLLEQKVTNNMIQPKKSKLDMQQEFNHDIRQRRMVESNNGKRRSDDHLQFLDTMLSDGEAKERSIIARQSLAESVLVIGGFSE